MGHRVATPSSDLAGRVIGTRAMGTKAMEAKATAGENPAESGTPTLRFPAMPTTTTGTAAVGAAVSPGMTSRKRTRCVIPAAARSARSPRQAHTTVASPVRRGCSRAGGGRRVPRPTARSQPRGVRGRRGRVPPRRRCGRVPARRRRGLVPARRTSSAAGLTSGKILASEAIVASETVVAMCDWTREAGTCLITGTCMTAEICMTAGTHGWIENHGA
jgi:hypothetical protein